MKAAIASVAAVAALASTGVDAKVARCPALEKGKKIAKSSAKTVKQSLLRKAVTVKKNPGVGADLEKVKAGMDQVYKDGYYHVACVNDGMRISADKHTLNGQRNYAAQNLDVSIVWYNTLVAEEDREAMTHGVCYNFCRRVEGMNYFGLQNGRGCYCTPYYKQEVGAGSEDCDMACDGNTATFCGGQTKSDIFQMHWCGDVSENLVTAIDLVQGKRMDLDEQTAALNGCAESVQTAGDSLQQQAAKNGDKFLGGWAQRAKVAAGVYKKLTRSADKTFGSANEAEMAARALQSQDSSSPDVAKAAEAAIDELDLQEVHVSDALDEVSERLGECQAAKMSDGERLKSEYFNVAKWTAKGFEEHSTSCAGEPIGAPSSRSPAECADLCDATVAPAKCVGFQSYKDTCVLLSAITEVSYYTAGSECTDADKAMCRLKMSESVGFAPKNGVAKQDRCFY